MWIKRVFHPPIRTQRNQKTHPQIPTHPKPHWHLLTSPKPNHKLRPNTKVKSFCVTHQTQTAISPFQHLPQPLWSHFPIPSHTQFQAFRSRPAVWVNGGLDQLCRSQIGGSFLEGISLFFFFLQCFVFAEAHLDQKGSERSQVRSGGL